MKVSDITLIKTISFQITVEEPQVKRISYAFKMCLHLTKTAFHRLYQNASFYFSFEYVEIQSIISKKEKMWSDHEDRKWSTPYFPY